jgi:hypothetical protein
MRPSCHAAPADVRAFARRVYPFEGLPSTFGEFHQKLQSVDRHT